LNDTDIDTPAASLSANVVNGPIHGTLTLNPNGSFTYTPAASFKGTDSFTYKANDGQLESNVATATITVTGPDRARSRRMTCTARKTTRRSRCRRPACSATTPTPIWTR